MGVYQKGQAEMCELSEYKGRPDMGVYQKGLAETCQLS